MGTTRAATQTTRLGRYRVVKRLAAGGMADVLLARTDGIEGFERHVVIKRIHADLLEEERYIRMFLDEARLAASLHHHNIVQVNDIGEERGEYFFAMEYVHGEDARALLVNATERGQQIPLEHVITIVTGAAAGLHHAHEQRGPDRAPLHIVHRDVSPANILVGFDGSVKVADFGIALAAHRAEQTQSGVLKGKVAYMSPEQCNCERVDRRSDVFSLGIVLYELATVHPCFRGENDFMTMSAIVNGAIIRPSQFNAAVSSELEAIIMKALARSPAQRYQSADELRIALEQYAVHAGLRTSTTALADYMKEQFGSRALPWLEEDAGDEPEIVLEPRSLIADDELAIPIEAPAAAARPSPRPVKQTLPLRAHRSRPQLVSVPDPDEAAGWEEPIVVSPLAPIEPAGEQPASSPSEPADEQPDSSASEPTVGTLAVEEPDALATASATAPEPTRVARGRRRWLIASLCAVIAAGTALAIVTLGDDAPGVTERRAKQVRPHVRALPPARLAPAATAAEAPRAAATPSTPNGDTPPSPTSGADIRSAAEPTANPAEPAGSQPAVAGTDNARAAQPAATPAPTAPARKPGRAKLPPKWDPDALFPE